MPNVIAVERLENGDYIHWGRHSRAFGDTMGACVFTGEDARVIDLVLKHSKPSPGAETGEGRRKRR